MISMSLLNCFHTPKTTTLCKTYSWINFVISFKLIKNKRLRRNLNYVFLSLDENLRWR